MTSFLTLYRRLAPGLSVLGEVLFGAALTVTALGGFAGRAWAQGWQTGSNTVYVPSGTSVGIGTASPSGLLHIPKNDTLGELILGESFINGADSTVRLGMGNSSGNSFMRLGQSTSNFGFVGWIYNATASSAYLKIGTQSGNNNTVLNLDGGKVGIGTASPSHPLSVNGAIRAKEVIINSGWSDYVFDDDYNLMPLKEVASFIKENHHLPGIPSEAEVKEKGVSIGDVQSKLLAKIEELTLHMIQADERSTRIEKENRALQARIASLEAAATQTAGTQD
jgi:hypothetical protein